ncbi:MAG: S1C family serine protease [Gammaproteobacteria bacterium]|nr:S1C family serine protease [Gammaproteobacteria bacterium]
MTDPTRPDPADVSFDLNETLRSIVSVRSNIIEDALTAAVLGTERAGYGALIAKDGLILTIGYLVAEAERIWIIDDNGQTVEGHVIGYDYESGFGLVQALQPLRLPVIELASAEPLEIFDSVIVAGQGGVANSIVAKVIAKQEFAGYWEYVLDEAIFTAPAHPIWGGTAMIGSEGYLHGIGSLLVQQAIQEGETHNANMMVPIDQLIPILDELKTYGRRNKPPRPWLGMLVYDAADQLVVGGIYDHCPADRAGIEVGDVIVSLDGKPAKGLATFFRRVWNLGDAGVEVPLAVMRGGDKKEVSVVSADRNDCMKSPSVH